MHDRPRRQVVHHGRDFGGEKKRAAAQRQATSRTTARSKKHETKTRRIRISRKVDRVVCNYVNRIRGRSVDDKAAISTRDEGSGGDVTRDMTRDKSYNGQVEETRERCDEFGQVGRLAVSSTSTSTGSGGDCLTTRLLEAPEMKFRGRCETRDKFRECDD